MRRLIEYVRGKGIGAETARYVLIGVLTTLFNYGLFELMYSIMRIGVTVSNVTSIAATILFAYVTNKLLVFRRRSGSRDELFREFFKFIGSRLFTVVLEVGVVEFFHSYLGYDARLCKIAALALVVITNYVFSKLVVFRNSEGS